MSAQQQVLAAQNLLGCTAMFFIECRPTFQRYVLRWWSPWLGRQHEPIKNWSKLNEEHGSTSQKILSFIIVSHECWSSGLWHCGLIRWYQCYNTENQYSHFHCHENLNLIKQLLFQISMSAASCTVCVEMERAETHRAILSVIAKKDTRVPWWCRCAWVSNMT
jgi:hypothetical protein